MMHGTINPALPPKPRDAYIIICNLLSDSVLLLLNNVKLEKTLFPLLKKKKSKYL